MSPENRLLTADDRTMLEHTVLSRHRLEEHYRNFEQQSDTAALGMWLFLATEIMFFGTLFTILGVYRFLYPLPFEAASEKLNWQIGGINTLVLLVSSFTMVLAVHYARLGNARWIVRCLIATALLGGVFLVLKGIEYYIDYRENLIPGFKFEEGEWTTKEGLSVSQVGQVKMFLVLYWVMTAFHGIHVTIGIIAVLTIATLAARGVFTEEYYSPVDVVGLYWHFVDIVWIFLLPMLYLLGTHEL